MRILHVTDRYFGSVGRAIDRITAVVPELEHHLLSPGPVQTAVAEGYRSARTFPDGLGHRARAVRDLVDELGPDVVHAHASWAGLYTRPRRLPVPVVYQPHFFYFERPGLPDPVRRAVREMERAVVANSAVFAAVSPHEESVAREMGAQVVERVPNVPSDAAVRRAGTRSGRAHQDRPTVTMAGRPTRRTDPAFFARTAELARTSHPRLVFRWLGDGDPQLVRELQEAGVEVSGSRSVDDVVRQMVDSDVYLHTAVHESFPSTVLDAVRVGLPTVVRDIPAFQGTHLTTAQSPAEALHAAGAAVEDSEQRLRMIDAGDRLAVQMNESALRDGVLRAYATAIGPVRVW